MQLQAQSAWKESLLPSSNMLLSTAGGTLVTHIFPRTIVTAD